MHWLAYAWQGAYATLLGKGVPVAYADPKEGRNSWVGVYCIRKDSPNQELALKFLDAKLGEKAGTNLVNNFYYGSANQDVMNAITDPTLREAFSHRRSLGPREDELHAEPDGRAARGLEQDVG